MGRRITHARRRGARAEANGAPTNTPPPTTQHNTKFPNYTVGVPRAGSFYRLQSVSRRRSTSTAPLAHESRGGARAQSERRCCSPLSLMMNLCVGAPHHANFMCVIALRDVKDQPCPRDKVKNPRAPSTTGVPATAPDAVPSLGVPEGLSPHVAPAGSLPTTQTHTHRTTRTGTSTSTRTSTSIKQAARGAASEASGGG